MEPSVDWRRTRQEQRRKHRKHLQTLGLAAVAAAALMAFVGGSTASASVLCKTKVASNGGLCPAGWGYEGEIHAVSEEPSITTASFKTVECQESTLRVQMTEGTKTGTETPHGVLTELTATKNCNCTVVISKEHLGELELHAIGDTGNGTITLNGLTETVSCNTIFGTVHCNYLAENDDLGTLTGSSTTGGAPTMDITAEVGREPTSGLCDEEAIWHIKYVVTTPSVLDVATRTS
jgi:hypothetical protein